MEKINTKHNYEINNVELASLLKCKGKISKIMVHEYTSIITTEEK